MVKQKGGGTGTKGSITGRFTETLIRPDGTSFLIAHELQFDRPIYKPLHIRLNARRKIQSEPIDIDTLKNLLHHAPCILVSLWMPMNFMRMGMG